VLENQTNQRITTLNTVYLAGHSHDQEGFVCSTLTISALP